MCLSIFLGCHCKLQTPFIPKGGLGIEPQTWFADIIARIPDYKINRVDQPMPWVWNADVGDGHKL